MSPSRLIIDILSTANFRPNGKSRKSEGISIVAAGMKRGRREREVRVSTRCAARNRDVRRGNAPRRASAEKLRVRVSTQTNVSSFLGPKSFRDFVDRQVSGATQH